MDDTEKRRQGMEDGKNPWLRFFPLLLAAFVHGTLVGYWTGQFLHEDKVEREAKEQFYGFVVATDRLGLINRQRLDELTADHGDAEDGTSIGAESADQRPPSCENPPPGAMPERD